MNEAGDRQRFIFVEDGAQWFHELYMSSDGPENIRIEDARKRVLEKFVEPLVGTDVEAVTYRVDQGIHYLFYDTKAGECVADTVSLLDRFAFPHRRKQIYRALLHFGG